MDLFQRAAETDRRGQPLAERMRPRSLAELVGQQQILGPGTWLRRALDEGRLGSMILWGPPGTGKTTLGRLLAAEIKAHFEPMSAVLSGVKDLREAIDKAKARLWQRQERTVLFVDEIHRFNKAQQDALLPHVEAGTVILVGATTENPSFEINAALLSRTKMLVLAPLEPDELRRILDAALEDAQRGYGGQKVACPPEIRDLIAREAGGDARRALGTLEGAVDVARPADDGQRQVDAETVKESLSRRALLYDKAGDEHYAVVSAFIKSMRGSDPDAAVYWMARMLEAGEDPLFVLRRMVIFAAEDVGNADPQALPVAIAALEAFRLVGLPEGYLPLTQAVTYLSCAPKSNTAMATYLAAKADVEAHGALPVPLHLRNAPTPLAKSLGHGAGYQYPHAFEGHHVAEQYLPDKLAGQRYYQPSDSGQEAAFGARLRAWREAAAQTAKKPR